MTANNVINFDDHPTICICRNGLGSAADKLGLTRRATRPLVREQETFKAL
jgi:hypothetical protein